MVAIEIARLTFYETATLYNYENQIQLYVAYRFLDVDPATLETPDSLPLPQPNRPIHFNFKKGRLFQLLFYLTLVIVGVLNYNIKKS